MTHDYDLLRRLSEAAGVPGREDRVRDLIRSELGPLADRARTDAMGNLIVEVAGPDGAPLVMVSAHMDEIGFVVRHVDDQGFLRVQNLGGFDVRNLFARLVTVHARRGGPRTGVLNPGVQAGPHRHARGAQEDPRDGRLRRRPRPAGRDRQGRRAGGRHGHAAAGLPGPRRRGRGQGARRPRRLLDPARGAAAPRSARRAPRRGVQRAGGGRPARRHDERLRGRPRRRASRSTPRSPSTRRAPPPTGRSPAWVPAPRSR